MRTLPDAPTPIDRAAAGTDAEADPAVAVPLGPAADAALLRLARRSLEAATGARALGPDELADPDLPDLRLGAFVTLTISGGLRGCMGRLDFETPLAENVVAAAFSVAHDPRFPPLEAFELDEVRVEVSAITRPEPIRGPDAFDVSRHGIVVERGWRRALLLPQVARERGWDATRTLRTVCEKAGLDRDDWRRPGTTLSVFLAHEAIEASIVPV